MLLGRFFDALIIASIGASSFILFITPQTEGARSKKVIGGSVCGTASGLIFSFLYGNVSVFEFWGSEYILIVLCGASVAAAAFLMVVFNLWHPPAAAIALGIATDPHSFKSAAATVISIIILCIIKHALKKHLKNLI